MSAVLFMCVCVFPPLTSTWPLLIRGVVSRKCNINRTVSVLHYCLPPLWRDRNMYIIIIFIIIITIIMIHSGTSSCYKSVDCIKL